MAGKVAEFGGNFGVRRRRLSQSSAKTLKDAAEPSPRGAPSSDEMGTMSIGRLRIAFRR